MATGTKAIMAAAHAARNYQARPWMMSFGFRQKIRTYADHELLGHVAIITGVTKTYVTVVTHTLFRVEVFELLFEDFFKLYVPDLYLTPQAAAKELRQCRNMMVVVPPCDTLIEEILKNPPTLEDFNVKAGKQSTSKKAVALRTTARACTDFNRRTCVELYRDDTDTYYIPLEIQDGLEIVTMDSHEFDKRYKSLENYPVDKAAKLYAEYSLHIGATKEAMQELAKLTPILDKEIEMATNKKATSTAAKEKAAAAKPAAKKAPAKPAAKAPAAKPAAKKPALAPAAKAKPAAAAGEKKESAANMFQELIMAGKLTDDQIFEQVQKKFGLDEKKRSYVKWYRNHLTKQGKNPPAAKA